MSAPTMTQAVVEVWDATAALPKLYNEGLPEDAPQLPAAYFLHGGEATGRGKYNTAISKPAWRDGRFDIVLFASGVVAVEALALLVLAALTPTSLAMTSSQEATLFQSNYACRGTDWRDKNGDQVYMVTLSYECFLSNPAA